ncbi:hypothetical protein MCERE19_01055 [Spirosomataceae bacterium]
MFFIFLFQKNRNFTVLYTEHPYRNQGLVKKLLNKFHDFVLKNK